jgi:hypothetical protein
LEAPYDESQRFWTGRPLPTDVFASAARLRLRRQMRNPPAIAALAAEYAGAGAQSREGAKGPRPKASEEVQVRVVPEAGLLDGVRKEIDRLRREKVPAHEIAVLSAVGSTRSRLVGLERIGPHPVARADADDAARSVIADTFLRFKGLERAFVIATDIDRARGERYDTRMHIAITRATVGVTVVCDEASLAADSRLAMRR